MFFAYLKLCKYLKGWINSYLKTLYKQTGNVHYEKCCNTNKIQNKYGLRYFFLRNRHRNHKIIMQHPSNFWHLFKTRNRIHLPSSRDIYGPIAYSVSIASTAEDHTEKARPGLRFSVKSIVAAARRRSPFCLALRCVVSRRWFRGLEWWTIV